LDKPIRKTTTYNTTMITIRVSLIAVMNYVTTDYGLKTKQKRDGREWKAFKRRNVSLKIIDS